VRLSDYLQLKAVTLASLPSCDSNAKYRIYAVSDASSPSYGTTLSGGGSTATIAFCDGVHWVAH
jgi:hypothetical protein